MARALVAQRRVGAGAGPGVRGGRFRADRRELFFAGQFLRSGAPQRGTRAARAGADAHRDHRRDRPFGRLDDGDGGRDLRRPVARRRLAAGRGGAGGAGGGLPGRRPERGGDHAVERAAADRDVGFVFAFPGHRRRDHARRRELLELPGGVLVAGAGIPGGRGAGTVPDPAGGDRGVRGAAAPFRHGADVCTYWGSARTVRVTPAFRCGGGWHSCTCSRAWFQRGPRSFT